MCWTEYQMTISLEKVLEEELDGTETQQEVDRLVREIMREVEACG